MVAQFAAPLANLTVPAQSLAVVLGAGWQSRVYVLWWVVGLVACLVPWRLLLLSTRESVAVSGRHGWTWAGIGQSNQERCTSFSSSPQFPRLEHKPSLCPRHERGGRRPPWP